MTIKNNRPISFVRHQKLGAQAQKRQKTCTCLRRFFCLFFQDGVVSVFELFRTTSTCFSVVCANRSRKWFKKHWISLWLPTAKCTDWIEDIIRIARIPFYLIQQATKNIQLAMLRPCHASRVSCENVVLFSVDDGSSRARSIFFLVQTLGFSTK